MDDGSLIPATPGEIPAVPVQDLDRIYDRLDKFDRAREGHHRWAEPAKMCTDFLEGNQWDPADRQKLLDEGRPVVTLNKIAPLRRVLIGYQRQNRYDIRYLPAGDGTGDDSVARALTHVVKQVGEQNQTQWNDSEVFSDGISGGRGFYDIRIDRRRNVFGEIVERVLDPFAVYLDPEAETYNPEGWSHVQISRWLSWNAVQTTFGPVVAEMVDYRGTRTGLPLGMSVNGSYGRDIDVGPDRFFGLYSYLNGDNDRFFSGSVPGSPAEHIDKTRKLIRTIETQSYETVQVQQFVDMQTGLKKTIPDEWGHDKISRVMDYAAIRGLPLNVASGIDRKVRCTITAADVILYDQIVPYDTFTVIPFFAYFRRGKTRGMIEDLLDPQRELNKRRAVLLHIIMTTANSGWIYEEGALSDEMEAILDEEGARPGIKIKYQNGYKPPTRIEAASAPAQFERIEKMMTSDIKEIAGINDSALGQVDKVQSGRAVIARQRQAVVGAEEYFDNFSRTRELKGRKYLELIQRYYTEERMVRVRGGDSTAPQSIAINQPAGEKIVNDVTLGSYQVAIDEAPMSATFEQSQFEDLVTMVKDLGIPIPPDIIVESSNVPRKREIVARLLAAQGIDPMAAAALGAAANAPPGAAPPGGAPAGAQPIPPGAAAAPIGAAPTAPGQLPNVAGPGMPTTSTGTPAAGFAAGGEIPDGSDPAIQPGPTSPLPEPDAGATERMRIVSEERLRRFEIARRADVELEQTRSAAEVRHRELDHAEQGVGGTTGMGGDIAAAMRQQGNTIAAAMRQQGELFSSLLDRNAQVLSSAIAAQADAAAQQQEATRETVTQAIETSAGATAAAADRAAAASREVAKAMRAPKRLVFDKRGKPAGVEIGNA